MSYIGNVKVGSTTHLVGSTLYGTCNTAANTAEKAVTCANFDQLLTGVTIHVKFDNTNTIADPTLNVNSTGAKAIKRYGTTAPSTSVQTSWYAGAVISFTYDGTYWMMDDWTYTSDGNTDTKVTQTADDSTNSDFEVIFSNTADNTTRTETAKKSSKLKFNPSTGNLQSTKLNGVTIGSSPKFTDNDTKVTSSANHYSPATASGQDKTASASGAIAAWDIDVVQGVTLNTDGKGHVTGLSVTSGKIPSNPNTDTNNRRGFYGTCSTAAATAAKTVTLSNTDGWELVAGTIVGVKFSNTNSAENVTLDINGTGNKSIYYSTSVYAGKASQICGTKNGITYYMYDGTNWVFINYSGNYTDSDTKVRQTLSTTNKNYPLLLSYAETSNTTANIDNVSYRANTIYANPSTGNIQAVRFNGISSVWSNAVSGAVGDTNVTVSDSSIATTSTITPYCSNSSGTPIALNTLTVSSGSAVISFSALTEATTFKLLIQN